MEQLIHLKVRIYDEDGVWRCVWVRSAVNCMSFLLYKSGLGCFFRAVIHFIDAEVMERSKRGNLVYISAF
jgi:hypothetical protein